MVVIGCGQWVTSVGGSVEGPVGVVTAGGQWCVVSQCGQWVQSMDVVNEGVVSWCGQLVRSFGVRAVVWSVSLLC